MSAIKSVKKAPLGALSVNEAPMGALSGRREGKKLL